MKYKVHLNYYKFTFNTRDEALDFAELALSASDEEITVKVEIEREPDPAEEENEEGEENE